MKTHKKQAAIGLIVGVTITIIIILLICSCISKFAVEKVKRNKKKKDGGVRGFLRKIKLPKLKLPKFSLFKIQPDDGFGREIVSCEYFFNRSCTFWVQHTQMLFNCKYYLLKLENKIFCFGQWKHGSVIILTIFWYNLELLLHNLIRTCRRKYYLWLLRRLIHCSLQLTSINLLGSSKFLNVND